MLWLCRNVVLGHSLMLAKFEWLWGGWYSPYRKTSFGDSPLEKGVWLVYLLLSTRTAMWSSLWFWLSRNLIGIPRIPCESHQSSTAVSMRHHFCNVSFAASFLRRHFCNVILIRRIILVFRFGQNHRHRPHSCPCRQQWCYLIFPKMQTAFYEFPFNILLTLYVYSYLNFYRLRIVRRFSSAVFPKQRWYQVSHIVQTLRYIA